MLPASDEKRLGARAPLWGVLGGMGPLASAEFLRTVYRTACRIGVSEQASPRVALVSCPDLPDRTEALAPRGRPGELRLLADRCEAGLAALQSLGAEHVFVCCFTAHAVLDRLPGRLLRGLVRLPQLVHDELAGAPGEALVLASAGAVHSAVFHPDRAGAELRLPSGQDQESLQKLLYRLKAGARVQAEAPALWEIVSHYRPARVVFGCTELHLFTAAAEQGELTLPYEVVDPLRTLAAAIAGQAAVSSSGGPPDPGDAMQAVTVSAPARASVSSRSSASAPCTAPVRPLIDKAPRAGVRWRASSSGSGNSPHAP